MTANTFLRCGSTHQRPEENNWMHISGKTSSYAYQDFLKLKTTWNYYIIGTDSTYLYSETSLFLTIFFYKQQQDPSTTWWPSPKSQEASWGPPSMQDVQTASERQEGRHTHISHSSRQTWELGLSLNGLLGSGYVGGGHSWGLSGQSQPTGAHRALTHT